MDLDDVNTCEQGESSRVLAGVFSTRADFGYDAFSFADAITNELVGNVPFDVKRTLMLLSK